MSKTTVVVLLHGRPQTFGRGNAVLATQVDALLAAWRPGEMGGTAIVDLLMGKETPSGKLSQSWPRTVGHVHSGSSPWLQPVAGKWVANNKGCESLSTEGRCYNPYALSCQIQSKFQSKSQSISNIQIPSQWFRCARLFSLLVLTNNVCVLYTPLPLL